MLLIYLNLQVTEKVNFSSIGGRRPYTRASPLAKSFLLSDDKTTRDFFELKNTEAKVKDILLKGWESHL